MKDEATHHHLIRLRAIGDALRTARPVRGWREFPPLTADAAPIKEQSAMSAQDLMKAIWDLTWSRTITHHAIGDLVVWRACWGKTDVRIWKWEHQPLWTGEVGGTALTVHSSTPAGAATLLARAVAVIQHQPAPTR